MAKSRVRSAVSGRFKTAAFGKKNPKTTVVETVKPRRSKPKKR